MFTALLLICLVSPINDYIDDQNCITGPTRATFEHISQCETYLRDEYALLQTAEGQFRLTQQLPLYHENRWKVRGMCTRIVLNDYITEVKP